MENDVIIGKQLSDAAMLNSAYLTPRDLCEHRTSKASQLTTLCTCRSTQTMNRSRNLHRSVCLVGHL
jgi:hypothetical protein